MVYAPDATPDPISIQASKDIRKIIYEADGCAEMHACANYAHGDESLQEMYGYEDWRRWDLKEAKRKYDPHGRFSFYAPIQWKADWEHFSLGSWAIPSYLLTLKAPLKNQ